MRIKDKYDMIIGAGVSGLTAGIILARMGKKVIIFEKNSNRGGCIAYFKRKNFLFEAGTHFLPSLKDKEGGLRKILSKLEVEDKLSFINYDSIYQFILPHGATLTIWSNKEKCLEEFTEKFPHERTRILQYFSLIEKVVSQLTAIILSEKLKNEL